MKSPTKWLKIRFTCPEKITEAVSDLIGVLSGVGVEIRPLPDQDKNIITGFFALGGADKEKDLETAKSDILQRVSTELEKLYAIYNLILSEPESEVIDNEDWATSWQQFFTAFEIVPGLVIKPSWEEFSEDAGQHVITMDPGMAFGTGQHASTRLALTLIASRFSNGNAAPRKILDVGTGTGILAMAGAVFGADQVMAIDIDPEAVQVAQRNIHANYMDWNIGVSDKPLTRVEGTYDLICANIIHDVLVEMAPDLRRLLNKNGQVILAGILQGEQEKNIEKVFRANGMNPVQSEYDEEWVAMMLADS